MEKLISTFDSNRKNILTVDLKLSVRKGLKFNEERMDGQTFK